MATGIIIGLIIGVIGGIVIGATLVLIRDQHHEERMTTIAPEHCKGTTHAGTPCQRRFGLINGYCTVHADQAA